MNNLNKDLSFKGQLFSCPLLFYIFLLAIAPACSKQTHERENVPLQNRGLYSSSSADINQSEPVIVTKQPHFKSFVQQARDIDITTPVGFKLIKADNNTHGTQFFVYQGNLGIEQIRSFYNRELELSGWDYKDLSTKHEGLLVANKTNKTGIVSIRSSNSSGNSVICITIAQELVE